VIVLTASAGGDDRLIIGAIGDADDFGDFNAAATFTGGLDLDIIRAVDGVNQFLPGPPLKSGFEQGT